MSRIIRWLEVPNYGHTDFKAGQLINADIRPLPPSRRTWTGLTYLTWWSIWQLSINSFQTGASLVALGLSVWQTMIAIIVARIITAAVAVLSGAPGAYWHIGFPVFSRSVWGIRGAYIPMLIRLFLTVVGMAVQVYIGGLCVNAILGAIFPTYQRLPNHIPADQQVTTQDLVGWVIFNLLSAAVLYIRPERSHYTIFALSIASFATMFGMAVWALSRAHGGGPLLSAADAVPDGSALAWKFLTGVLVAYGGTIIAAMGQTDFSRFARKPGDQVAGQWLAFCVVGVVSPLFGCLTASATLQLYGQPVWNPPVLALTWLATDYAAATSRAGAFFVGLGLVCSQLGITMVDNGYGAGMDFAGIVPRFVNIRRGSYIVLAVSLVIFPWRIVATAGAFVSVIGSFVAFIAPITGLQLADYYVVRGKVLKLSHLYDVDASGGSIYWYTGGFNLRALAAWLVGFAPCLPGVIGTVNPMIHVGDGALHLYSLTWIYGFLASFLVYCGLSKVFPPAGLGEYDETDIFGTFTEAEAAYMLNLKNGMMQSSMMGLESHDSDAAAATAAAVDGGGGGGGGGGVSKYEEVAEKRSW